MGMERMNRERAAILAVSYGCAAGEMKERTLDRIEADIRAAYPAYPVCHAWTSQTFCQKIWEREGIRVPGVKEAMEELLAKGIRKVAVQPTHVLDGVENRRMIEDIQAFSQDFSQLMIGGPLLASRRDTEKAARVIGEEFRLPKEEALVLAGHGTIRSRDAVYREVNEMFGRLGYENVFLGTMEGRPGLEEALECVRKRKPRRIYLAPFMITAGNHAVRTMAGEQKTSWKSRLEEAGFAVTCIRKGLGEYEGIRGIFVEHLRGSMKRMDENIR